jgi:thioesterase domain-containing protein
LQMLQLAYGIERLLHKPIAIDAMWPQMNVRELADRLNGKTTGDIPAQNARSVVMVPGINGDEPKLVEFRKLLGRGFRYFVPTYPAWEALVEDETSFAGIVDDVVAQIRENVAQRPLVIVGYSFGGYVAYEIARQMEASGEDVAFVGILDSKIVAAERLDPDDTFVRKVVRDLRNEGVRKAIALRIGHGIALAVYRSARLRRAVARSRTGLPLPAEIAFPFDFKITRFVREALSNAWRPGTSSVPMTLYRSESYPPGTARDLGWGSHASSLTVEDVGGLHDSMIVGSHGEKLARSLRDAIGASVTA